MRTITAKAPGGPDVLQIADAPVPEPAPGQVLVRVLAASVNFADAHRRAGRPYPFPTTFPFTPGSEVAGVIEHVGPGTDAPPVGTRVFGVAGADGSGGYAEYAIVAAASVIPTPDHLADEVAATLPVAGTTAHLALHRVGNLQAGERVLIESAGGGVGTFAIQLGKLAGATVIAAATTAGGRDAAAAAGADTVIDATATDYVARVRSAADGGVDLVLNSSGGDGLARAVDTLAPFGRVVVLGSASGATPVLEESALRRIFVDPALGLSLTAFNLGLVFGLRPAWGIDALGGVIAAVADGSVQPVIGHAFPLERAADAHRVLEARSAHGKLVLRP